MLKTKGYDWLTSGGGKSWCKLVRRIDEIDLHERGGFAVKSSFVGFDRTIMLDTEYFLIVASQFPRPTASGMTYQEGDPTGWEYRYALVETFNGQLRAVTEDQLYRTVYAALDTGMLIPEEREHNAVGNWQYMAAVYMTMVFKGLASRPALTMPGRRITGGRRKIIRLNNTTPAASKSPPRVSAVQPPSLPPPKPQRTGKSIAQILSEAVADAKRREQELQDNEVCYCGILMKDHTITTGCSTPCSISVPVELREDPFEEPMTEEEELGPLTTLEPPLDLDQLQSDMKKLMDGNPQRKPRQRPPVERYY